MTVRLKKFEKKLNGISLDENDLVRLGNKVQNAATKYEGTVKITITSYDGEDQLKSMDPQIFLSSDMIRRVKEIKIEFNHFEELQFFDPIVALVIFLAVPDPKENFSYYHQPSKLEVYGSDIDAVISIFYELQRELFSLLMFPNWVVNILYSTPFRIVLRILFGFISAFIVYLIFDIPLDITAQIIDGFKDSTLHIILAMIGWVFVALSFLVGGDICMGLTKRILPPVRFAGSLSDANSDVRKFVLLIFGIVLLPIILNIFSSIIVST